MIKKRNRGFWGGRNEFKYFFLHECLMQMNLICIFITLKNVHTVWVPPHRTHTEHRCYNCFAMITADMNWSWFNTISIPCIFFFFSFFAMSALCCAQTRPVNELPLSGIFLPFRAFIHSSMLFQLIFLSNITWHHLNHLKWFKQLLCHSLHRSTDHRLIV